MKSKFILSAIILLLFSCKEEIIDPCLNIQCFNGGTCIEGTCQCPTGYNGVNCEIPPDPCAGILCINGGNCINGACICPDGFTGVACEQQVKPTKITYSNFVIKRFPPTSNGTGWDLFDAPDLQLLLMDPDGNTIIGPVLENYSGNAPVNFDWTISTTNKLDELWTIRLVDQDLFPPPSDFMGGYTFTPHIDGNPFFIGFDFDDSSSEFAIKASKSYDW